MCAASIQHYRFSGILLLLNQPTDSLQGQCIGDRLRQYPQVSEKSITTRERFVVLRWRTRQGRFESTCYNHCILWAYVWDIEKNEKSF
jgi:hypothetical protein